MINCYLFGAPRFERDDQPIYHNRTKGVALLAYLAATSRPYSRESLATLFWPEHDDHGARNNLRRELSLLKKVFGDDALLIERTQAAVNPALWQVDVCSFRNHLATVQRHNHEATRLCAGCLAALQAAIDLYGDAFMLGFNLPDCPAFDEWQFFQREELRQSFAGALQALIAYTAGRAQYDEAIPLARRWLELDRLHEAAHRELMRLYAQAGQWSAALRQYEQCLQILAEELGVEPAEETQALFRAINRRELATPAAAPAARPARTPPLFKHNLRPYALPFIGREKELEALQRYLDAPTVRLITIVGPGGMGKTRLATASAEKQLAHPERYPDGIFFVPLAALSQAGNIYPAIAEALDFSLESGGRPARTPREQLLDYLRQKQLLLILDNFEHLPAANEVVSDLLAAAPAVQIVVTSRERLYLHEEYILSIQGLAFPASTAGPQTAGYPAVQLFVQSAMRAQHDFALTAENAAEVAHICRLVQGMPLAVELAASWVDLLSLGDIATEIERNLDFLQSAYHNMPERQRSIRAVFDSTWQRLSPPEQDSFRRLSLFRGGFTREAAQEVAGASLPMLSRLAAKSLLQFDRKRERYEVHELLRQYGVEQLAQEPAAEQATRDSHSAYYCALPARLLPDIEGAHKRDALRKIEVDLDNIHAAWDWALDNHQYERLCQATPALEHFYYWRARIHQAQERFRRATEQLAAYLETTPDPEQELPLAYLQARYANFTVLLGGWDTGRASYEASLELIEKLLAAGHDVREEKAYLLMKMGDVADTPEIARQRFAESLELYQEVGHEWWSAGLRTHLGTIAMARGRYEEAQEWFAASLAAYEALGDRWQFGWVLDGMSNVALYQNRLEEAEQIARRSLAIHREIGLRDRIADSLATLAWIALAGGKSEEAREYCQEAAAIWREMGLGSNTVPADQPFSPRWFSDVVRQRMAAIVKHLPPEMAAEVQTRARELDLWS